MIRLHLFLTWGSLCFLLQAVAQTGPAGVGTNDGTSTLKLWYRPDNGITTSGTSVTAWTNSAGETAHDLSATGTSRPTLTTAAQNGYDELSFDGGDFMRIAGPLTTSNFITNQASSFVVSKVNSTTASWVYATSPHQSDRFSCHISWSNGTVYYDIGGCCGTNSRIQVGGLPSLTSYSYWSYDAENTSGKQLYRNGTLLQNRAGTLTYTSHASHLFRIGETYNGTLTEVIIFREKINSAERLVIENYLSAKYNITASANDIYTQDDPGNGNYDHDVAGIGRVDASNIHDDAKGTGIVRILSPSGLGNNEYLFWGHDNGQQEASETTDIPAGVQGRFARVWRVSEVNASGTAVDVGSVSMRFDLTGLGAVTASDLRLLVDTDGDGLFADETPINGATSVGGNEYQFAGVTALIDGRRFTLGTSNLAQTPLPIELISFDAKAIDEEQVQLDWKTASEINNDYFTIERSVDGQEWVTVARKAGALHSNTIRTYKAMDLDPVMGVSYYRLKQVDRDGRWSVSHVRKVHLTTSDLADVRVYPNPAEDQVTLSGLDVDVEQLKVFNAYGQEVTTAVTLQKVAEKMMVVQMDALSPGIYWLATPDQAFKVVRQTRP